MIFALTSIELFLFAIFFTLFSFYKKRSDYADIAWGFGFILLSWSSFFLGPNSSLGMLLSILVTLWALRLSFHIYLRNKGKKEDERYQKLAQESKLPFFSFLFFKVYLLQGFLLYIIAFPILWMNSYKASISIESLYPGMILWAIGYIIEVMSDFSLYQFKKQPGNRGKLLMKGLWKYSRHPNYLGEILQWFAIWALTLQEPLSWILLISPLTITSLLLFVSGIPMLEKKMKTHPDFPLYSKNTPLLIPTAWTNGAISLFGFWGLMIYSNTISLISIAAQIALFIYQDRKSLLLVIPLSSLAFILSLFYFPFITLVPLLLFSLTLNASLKFLNDRLWLTSSLTFLGSVLFYNFVMILDIETSLLLGLITSVYVTLLILYNRSLVKLFDYFTSKECLENTLTLFFDGNCPICQKEMKWLQKRKGAMVYVTAKNDDELKQWTDRFTFEESMKTMHSIDKKGNIYKGVDTLAEMYARTSLPFISILLKAKGFHTLFKLFYVVWAKFRPRSNGSCPI